MEFAIRLQELRRKSGMSQIDLADRLDVSRQAVSKWESGQSFPETDKIIQISDLFQVSLDDLLKGEDCVISDMSNSLSVEEYASTDSSTDGSTLSASTVSASETVKPLTANPIVESKQKYAIAGIVVFPIAFVIYLVLTTTALKSDYGWTVFLMAGTVYAALVVLMRKKQK